MLEQSVIFNRKQSYKWVIFHDESICEQDNFLYHGFLFVRSDWGKKEVKGSLLQPFCNKRIACNKIIHFNELRGLGLEKSMVAIEWLKKSLCWLSDEKVKFYCFGVNLNNVNYSIFGNNSHEKIYKRFYEIGLRAALGWFGITGEDVSHVYYDQGKQDIDRYNKSLRVCGYDTVVSPLYNGCDKSYSCLSKFLQLTDIILGTLRKSFVSIGVSKTAQKKCVDLMYEIVDHFSKESESYNINHQFYKKFCFSFFPRSRSLTAEEFFNRDINYYIKTAKAFYCERDTYIRKKAKEKQMKLFNF